jgi:hypothetical protein
MCGYLIVAKTGDAMLNYDLWLNVGCSYTILVVTIVL